MPTDQEVQLAEKYGGESLARLVTHQSNVHEDAATYYPTKALILFEEAQAIGIVPKFEMSEDSEYDMRNFPPAAAEVALLTLIRKIKRHVEAFGEKRFEKQTTNVYASPARKTGNVGRRRWIPRFV